MLVYVGIVVLNLLVASNISAQECVQMVVLDTPLFELKVAADVRTNPITSLAVFSTAFSAWALVCLRLACKKRLLPVQTSIDSFLRGTLGISLLGWFVSLYYRLPEDQPIDWMMYARFWSCLSILPAGLLLNTVCLPMEIIHGDWLYHR